VTHRSKALDENYNFGLDLIPIRGLCMKLWPCRVVGVPALAVSRLLFGSRGTKSHLDVALVERCKVYYMGKVVASPSPGRGESCEPEVIRGLF